MHEEDLLYILRRFDLDQDARLNYKEFANAILPQTSSYKLKHSSRTHYPHNVQRSLPVKH